MKHINLTKFTALLVALIMVFSLSACGGSGNSGDAGSGDAAAADGLERATGFAEGEVEEEPDEAPDRGPATLTPASAQSAIAKADGTLLASDAYLYRNLLSDNDKKAYDTIRAGLLEGSAEIAMSIPVKAEDFKTIYNSVYYDSPEIFWVESGYTIAKNKNGIVTKVKPKYNSLFADRENIKKKIFDATVKPVSDMWWLKDNAEKVKYAHDYLIGKIEYDGSNANAQNIYSALIEGKSVCTGYTKAFQYLMQRAGIPCTCVVGEAWYPTTATKGAHTWNLVKIDGEFYAIDVTWDDPIGGGSKVCYDYFNLTDEVMCKDHAKNAISAALPVATGSAKNFANGFGGNKYGTDFAAVNGATPEGYETFGGFYGAN